MSRAFWRSFASGDLDPVTRQIAESDPHIAKQLKLPPTQYTVVHQGGLDFNGRDLAPGAQDTIRTLLETGQIAVVDGRTYVHRDLLDPLGLSIQVCRQNPAAPELNDIQYFVMRSIRLHHRVSLTGGLANSFETLAHALNRELAQGDRQYHWLQGLEPAIKGQCGGRHDAINHLDLFMECCRAANLFSIGRAAGAVWFYAQVVDSEYLLSRLFGLPVRIPGFDKLVGGGGLYLLDDPVELHAGRSRDALPGRVVLATGRFGTGKSLLALQIAVEVARKRGVAWVMPLEQSFSECIYALESMGMRLSDEAFLVARNLQEARDLWSKRPDGQGALIFLRQAKDSYAEFLELLDQHAGNLSNYELRLLVIDPISAVHRDPKRPATELRSPTVDVLRTLKDRVINIWINAEEDSIEGEHEFFEQNIADTVIALSVDDKHGFTQHYIEITKSRLQREIRGKQPFSITSQRGVEIDLSPAAWSQIARGRTVRPPRESAPSGTRGLDEILGGNGISASDVIVLQGPEGSSKTLIGLQFLLGFSHSPQSHSFKLGQSLLVTDQDRISTQVRLSQIDSSSESKTVSIVPVDRGYIQPGNIFRRIDDEIRRVRVNSEKFIDRVMIDNLARWEMSCPFIQQDRTFGVSLVEYLRRHSVTSVFTCGDQSEEELGSILQKSVIDSADCLIRFYLHEVQGRTTVFLRVLRTRDMRHRREMFELLPEGHGVRVQEHPTPLRLDSSGRLSPPRIRLVLHSETDAQHVYNEEVLAAIKASIAPATTLEEPAVFNTDTLALGAGSSLDEVQIVQLDEYQIPSDTTLYTIHDRPNRRPYIPRIERKVKASAGLAVIPYYLNISFLVFRQSVGDEHFSTWRALADASGAAESEVFFDCVFHDTQAYNTFFLEILIGMLEPRGGRTCLDAYLSASSGDFAESLWVFCKLGAGAYGWHRRHGPGNIKNAQVWRQWYGTAGRAIEGLRTGASGKQREIGVRPMPHGVSSAGEWYLGVPAYSDSPGIAEDIIRIYTTERAEHERLRLEIGLPCSAGFYDSGFGLPGETRSISRHFSFELSVLRHLVENAIERSCLPGYDKWSWTLASQLQRILELGPEAEPEIEQIARSLYSELLAPYQ